MKLVSTDVKLVGDELMVGGVGVRELLDRAHAEEVATDFDQHTAALPEEDLSPAHVVPAVITTKLTAT